MNETCKCSKEIGKVQSNIISTLWEASEGQWEDAEDNINRRLKPSLDALEMCIDKKDKMIFEENQVNRMTDSVHNKNMSKLMAEAKSFVEILPHDVCEFLQGKCPYKPELCK